MNVPTDNEEPKYSYMYLDTLSFCCRPYLRIPNVIGNVTRRLGGNLSNYILIAIIHAIYSNYVTYSAEFFLTIHIRR